MLPRMGVFIFFLLSFFLELHAQGKPDTLIRMGTFDIPYGKIKQPIVLYKCLQNDKYLIVIGESNVDSSKNQVVSTMSFSDFSSLVQESFKENLVLSNEPYLNTHLTDSLFGADNFKSFLKDYVYAT